MVRLMVFTRPYRSPTRPQKGHSQKFVRDMAAKAAPNMWSGIPNAVKKLGVTGWTIFAAITSVNIRM